VVPGGSPPYAGAIDFVAALRRETDAPVLAIGALSASQIVRLLETGADDCVLPTTPAVEVVARLRALLRRREPTRRTVLSPRHALLFARMMLDLDRRELRNREGSVVPLTESQFALLALFASHPGMVLGRHAIARHLMRGNWSRDDRSIDMAVGRIRQKIEVEPRRPSLLKTVRGQGYVFVATVETVGP
jgi:DNA-binding response OmpR family regulator